MSVFFNNFILGELGCGDGVLTKEVMTTKPDKGTGRGKQWFPGEKRAVHPFPAWLPGREINDGGCLDAPEGRGDELSTE